MSEISIIAAVASNYAIGKNNGLLCHIPGDLKRFKEITTGHTVVMGRRTLESLPNGPLPNRKNIVLTSMPETIVNDCVAATSIEDALEVIEHEDEVFVIGGGAVYKQFMSRANKLYITWINNDFEADTFFPEINLDEWKEISREEHSPSEKCPYSFAFVNYERK